MKVPYSPVGETTPSNESLRGPSGAGGTPEAFGAGAGRGLQNVGQAADGLTNYFLQKQEEVKKFDAMSRFSDFQTAAQDAVIQQSRNYDPTKGATFVPDVKDTFLKMKNDFVSSLPPDLQNEFSARAEAVGNELHGQALKIQLDAMDTFTKQGLTSAYDKSRQSLDQDGSPTNLDAQRTQIEGLLANSGLSEAEKQSLRWQFNVGLESTSYKSEVRNGKIKTDALGVGSGAQAGAFTLLQEFMPHLTTDQAKATASAAETVARAQIKPDVWAAQNDPTRAALLSLIADKGKLPVEVINALQSGGDVADAVEKLGGDRRKAEAAVIRGDALLPQSEADADPRYADIPYEDRLSLRADAEREVTADATAAAAQDKARNASVINALQVGLTDGTAGQTDIETLRQAGIMTDIDDIKKSQDILDKRTADIQLAAEGQRMLSQGVTFNPNDADHVKIENALIGKQGIQALNNQDSKYAATSLVPMVRQMQDIPPDVAGTLTGMVRSNDPNKALWALDLLSQLQQASPRGYDARTTTALASDVALWQSGKDYYPQDKLLEILHGGDSQEQRVRSAALRDEAKQVLASDKTGPAITGDVLSKLGVTGGFLGQGAVDQQALPWAAQGAMADFKELFEAEYSRVGNVDLAKNNAMQLLQKDWGVSPVGGGHYTLMKYPPDKYYPAIGGNHDWMTQQGAADLKLQPGESFQLVADDQTREDIEKWRSGIATSSKPPVPTHGLIEPGNIDTTRRQRVDNPDGTYSTELSMSFEEDGQEILVPTVFDGAHHSDEEAIANYHKTGQHLGKFTDAAAADDYAQALHARPQEGVHPPSYRAVILDQSGNWRMYKPWIPGADRLYFDTKPVIAQQGVDWLRKRADQQQSDAERTLGDAIKHEQETGTPIPEEVINENMMMMPSSITSGAGSPNNAIP